LEEIRGKLEAIMKIDVKEMGWDGVVGADLAHDGEQVAICCVRGDEFWVP
jgi:hypothetical protein